MIDSKKCVVDIIRKTNFLSMLANPKIGCQAPGFLVPGTQLEPNLVPGTWIWSHFRRFWCQAPKMGTNLLVAKCQQFERGIRSANAGRCRKVHFSLAIRMLVRQLSGRENAGEGRD